MAIYCCLRLEARHSIAGRRPRVEGAIQLCSQAVQLASHLGRAVRTTEYRVKRGVLERRRYRLDTRLERLNLRLQCIDLALRLSKTASRITRCRLASRGPLLFTHAPNGFLIRGAHLCRVFAIGRHLFPFGKAAVEIGDAAVVEDPHPRRQRAK